MSSYIRQNNKGSTMVMEGDGNSENGDLVIDESRTGSPMNGRNDVNIPANNTEQPDGIENPINYITLMQNFEKIRNTSNNFPSSQNISNQKIVVDANQAHKPGIACKDFSRKLFSTNGSGLLNYLTKDTTNVVNTISTQITDVSNQHTPKGSGNIHSEDTSTYSRNRHNGDTPRDEGNSQYFNNLHFVNFLESPIRPPTGVYVPKPPKSASLKADNPFDDSPLVNTSLIQNDPNLSGRYLAQIEHLNQRDPRTNVNFQGVTRVKSMDPIRAAARIAQRRKSVPAPPMRQAATNAPTALTKNVRQSQIGYQPQREPTITTGNTLPPTQGIANMVAHLRSTLGTPTYLGPMSLTQIQATHAATTSGMNGYPVPIGHQTHIDPRIATNTAVCGNLPFIHGMLSVNHHQASVTSHPGTLSGTTRYVYGQAANTLPRAMNVTGCLPQTRTALAAHEREVSNHQSLLLSKCCGSVIISTPEGQRYSICKPGYPSRKGTTAPYSFNLERPANTLQVPLYCLSSVRSCNVPREHSLYPNIHPGVPICNVQPNRWSEPNLAHTINPNLLQSPLYRGLEVDSSTYLATNISPTHVNTPGRSDNLNRTPTITANIQKAFDTNNCKPTPNQTVITKPDTEKKTRKRATTTLTKKLKSIKFKKFKFNPQETKNEVKITQSSLNQVILNKNDTNINNTEVSIQPNMNIAQTCVTDSSNSLILSPNTTQKEQTDACTHSNKIDVETKLALLHADTENLKTVIECMTKDVQSNAIKLDNCDMIDIETALDFMEWDTARAQTGVTETTITILPSTDQNVQINDATQQAIIKTNIEADLKFAQISDTSVVLLPNTTQKFEIDDVAQKANNKIDNKDEAQNILDTKTDEILTDATHASNTLYQSPYTTQTIQIDTVKHESNNKLHNETKLVLLDSNAERTKTKVPRTSDGVIKSLDTVQNVQAIALTQNPIKYMDIEAKLEMLLSNTDRDQKGVISEPINQTINDKQNVEADAFKQQIINDTDVKTAETLLHPNAGREQTNVTLNCNPHILSTNVLEIKATRTSTTTKTTSHKSLNNGVKSKTCTNKGDVNSSDYRRIYKLKRIDFETARMQTVGLVAAVKQIMNNPNILVPKTETLVDILNKVQHITPNTSKPVNTLNGSQISNDSGSLIENAGTNICTLPCMQVEKKNRDVENVVSNDCKSENILNADQNTTTYKTLVDILNKVQQIKPKTIKTYNGDETDNANTQHITVCKLKGNNYWEELENVRNDIKRENPLSDEHDTSVSTDAERFKIAREKLARLRTMEHVQADNDIKNNVETNIDHKYNTKITRGLNEDCNAEETIVSSVDTSYTRQNYHINFSTGNTGQIDGNDCENNWIPYQRASVENIDCKLENDGKPQQIKMNLSDLTKVDQVSDDINLKKEYLSDSLTNNSKTNYINKINTTSNNVTKKCNNEYPRNLNTNLVVNNRNDNIQTQTERLRSLNRSLATNDKQNNVENQTDNQLSLNTILAEIDKHDKSQKQIYSSEKEKIKHTNLASNSCKSNDIVINMINISAPTLDTSSTDKSSVVKKIHYDSKRKAFYESDESTIENDLANWIKKQKGNCESTDQPKTIQDSDTFKDTDVSNSNGNNELPEVKITGKNKIKFASSNPLKKSSGNSFYRFECPICTMLYVKARCFVKHLTKNHDVKESDVDISKYSILMIKCGLCSNHVKYENQLTHVKTLHGNYHNLKVKMNKQN